MHCLAAAVSKLLPAATDPCRLTTHMHAAALTAVPSAHTTLSQAAQLDADFAINVCVDCHVAPRVEVSHSHRLLSLLWHHPGSSQTRPMQHAHATEHQCANCTIAVDRCAAALLQLWQLVPRLRLVQAAMWAPFWTSSTLEAHFCIDTSRACATRGRHWLWCKSRHLTCLRACRRNTPRCRSRTLACLRRRFSSVASRALQSRRGRSTHGVGTASQCLRLQHAGDARC